MDNNVELKGLDLLYYLMKRFNMSYNDAIKEMEDHNQDVEQIKTLVNTHMLNNIKLNKEVK